MVFDCLFEIGEAGVATRVANSGRVTGKRVPRSNNIDKKLVDIGVRLIGGMKYSSSHRRQEIGTTHNTTESHLLR